MISPIPHTHPLEFPIRAPIAQPIPQTRYGLSNYRAYLQALEDAEQAQTLSQLEPVTPRVGRGWGVLGTALATLGMWTDRPLEWLAIGAACWMLCVARGELSR